MSRAPNILFIMSDDHASHAMSCYGSRINRTPNLDRIAAGGMRFDNCFCTNSICTPSRAAILTGTYNHVNGVTTLATMMDNRLQTFPKLLQAAGYQTAHVGKWHLGQGPAHWPTGFDYWTVFPGQGRYHDPEMVEMTQPGVVPGYATDIVTDHSLRWLRQRDRSRPFLLMCHHKAPHRPWEPHPRHSQRYEDEEIPYPETFDDDYAHRARAAAAAQMRVERDFVAGDVKVAPPDPGHPRRRLGAGADPLTPVGCAPVSFAGPSDRKRWLYQRYIKDYLRCVDAIDEGVGRLLDYLDDDGIADDTIIVYTSDQGFFLGDHGWYDKRFMYEESLRMPFIVRYPRAVQPGTVNGDMILNVDFAETFLDYAGVAIPDDMQGRSLRPLLAWHHSRRLAHRHVLPLLDARHRSQRVGALRGAHAHPQAHLLLRRPAGHSRQHRPPRGAGMGAVRPAARPVRDALRVRRPTLRRAHRGADRSPERAAGRRRRPAPRAGSGLF